MDKLTPKQKAFADNYIKNGGNAEKAALDAGYSKNYAKAQSYKMLDNVGISAYIAERQEEIEKQNGHDIMTLTEIQERRSRIGKGLEVDSFGFAADFSSQLKAMSDLEKILLIKEEQEEKQRAAEKGPGSVEYGFKWLQRRTLVIDRRRTPNVYEEFKNYEYDRDKDGNIISGYPEGQDDHAIAATRYAFEPLFNKRGNSA